MAKTPYADLVVPDDPEKPDIPAHLWQLANQIDPRLNLVCADEGERNTKYGTVPAGTLVSSVDGWQWLKIGPGAEEWHTLRSVETYTGFSWADGWADNNGSNILRVGGQFDIYMEAVYSGPDVAVNATGFMPNTPVATVTDPLWRPRKRKTTFAFSGGFDFSGWGEFAKLDGVISLTDGRGSTTLTAGTVIIFSDTYMNLEAAGVILP